MTEANHAPTLPDVVDEAGETPAWVPWLGVGLLLVAVLYASLGGGHRGAETPAAADARAVDARP